MSRWNLANGRLLYQSKRLESAVVGFERLNMHAFTPILAEVSDKVPTIGGIWAVTAVLSLACLLVSAWQKRAAFMTLPCICLWAIFITSGVRDLYLGPAILRELGRRYVTQVYIAAVAPVAFVVIGYLRSKRLPPNNAVDQKQYAA